MISALDNALLQKYITMIENEACVHRMNHWLTLFLDARLDSERYGISTDPELREVLEKVLSYTRYTKVEIEAQALRLC